MSRTVISGNLGGPSSNGNEGGLILSPSGVGDGLGVQLPAPIHWPTFWESDFQQGAFVLPDVVPVGRHVELYARAKEGKSLLVLDGAAALATGRSLYACTRPSDPVSVLYLDMEMTEDDLHDRLQSLGYGPDDDLSRLFYLLLPDLPPLNTALGAAVLEALLDRHHPALVVIDTVGRVVVGEENSADTMRLFYRHSGMVLKRAGVSSIRLDHEGKDPGRGPRGSSAKGEDVDVVWRLTRAHSRSLDTVTLKRTAARVNWVPETVAFTREVVNDVLRHVRTADAWPAGAKEVVDLLDRMGAPIEISGVDAVEMLRDAGCSKRRAVVLAANRLRRERGLESCQFDPEAPADFDGDDDG